MKVFLAFDIGTTSVKGCAFDEGFHRIASVNEEYLLIYPEAHKVEMDPEAYWRAVMRASRRILEQGILPGNIASVTFTTQGETMIPVDKDGQALSNAVVWLDDRAQEEARLLSERIGQENFYRHTGVPELSAATPVAKLLWHVRSNPALHARVYKYLLLEDWLVLRMTGRFVTETSLLSSTGYFDIRKRIYWSEALEACGVPEAMLPDAVACGSAVGGVNEIAASQTGLAVGTLVIAGAMDQVCAAIGAGNVQEGVLAENTGTCLAVTATSGKPVYDETGCMQVYTHYDDRYMLLLYNPTAAVLLKWFKDAFMGEFCKTLPDGVSVYDEMTKAASKVPALSGGLTLLPHFCGRLFPDADPDMQGAFVGIGLDTTRAHFIRAILESVAYMLRQSVEVMRDSGIDVRSIRSVGGASVSRLWNEIKSTVTGLSILSMRESESTSLGAAILGAWGVGEYDSVEQICECLIQPVRHFEPIEADIAAYERGFKRFLEINRRLSGL